LIELQMLGNIISRQKSKSINYRELRSFNLFIKDFPLFNAILLLIYI